MKSIVISQPMYFPWLGMHEQMRLADEFVRYDDVAFSKGSFTNRVQVKTNQGFSWLTLPLKTSKMGVPINEIALDDRQNWRRKHRATLQQSYAKAPFSAEMLEVVDSVFDKTGDSLSEVAMSSMLAVHHYFGFERPIKWHSISTVGVKGEGSERVLDIVHKLGGDAYITGHGAKNYLNHDAFEKMGIDVQYIDYEKVPYPQLHGDFNPYVTTLDLIANCGRAGKEFIRSGTKPWREFLGTTI